MQTDITENLAGILVVAGKLRTTEIMVPCMDGINALTASLFLQKLNEFLSNTIHATYGWYYPHLVSYTYFAILAHIALEGTGFLGNVQLLIYWMIGIFQRTGKVGLEIVLIHPFTLLQILLGMTDRLAILDDVLSLGSIIDEYLMTSWSILQESDVLAIHFDNLALLHRTQTNHYRVGRVNLDKA